MMSQPFCSTVNLESLNRFWRRASFHDCSVEEVIALNKRVIIRLKDYTLIITGATDLKRCELPAVWLREALVVKGKRFSLDIETDAGHLRVGGDDIRLIRNSDLAMLIPPIDA